jgi:hypothetical protein
MSVQEDFVEIDGRKVPTVKGLRKLGLLTIGGSFVTTTTKVTDDDYLLTPELIRAIVWNLKKYSSLTFMKQLKEIITVIEAGYENHLKMNPTLSDEIDIKNMKLFNESISDLDKAIPALLAGGDKSAIYRSLRNITRFDFAFTGRMRGELDWSSLGQGRGTTKSTGIYVLIEKAIDMAFSLTLGGTWTWPSILTNEWMRFPVPPLFNYVYEPKKVVCKTGDIIPQTGIWNPFDYKSGCPSFLLAGEEFPATEIAVQKREDPEYVDSFGVYQDGTIIYDYKEHPSRWELLWEDTRYLDGTIPEEEKEYLDESCSFPDDPPEAVSTGNSPQHPVVPLY